jgi:hypothetical protein
MAITRQEYRKGPNGTTVSRTSRGDGSNLFNVTETMHGNGNVSIVSDLVTKNIVQTDSSNSVGGNNISDTSGSLSQWVNEAAEMSSNSSYRIVGNLANVRNGFFRETDAARGKMVAMRSGFNDDRNDGSVQPDASLMSMSSNKLSNVSVMNRDMLMGDDEPIVPPDGNIFTNPMGFVDSEISAISSRVSKVRSASSSKQTELSAKNKAERQRRMLANIERLPDSPNKERLRNEIASGNLNAAFTNPSNEGRVKTNTFDRDQYEAEAVEVSNRMMNAERELR